MKKSDTPSLHGLDVKTLRLYEAVASTGSLTQAARANHLAVGAASRRISNFETMIGKPLLERNTRGLRLTPAASECGVHHRDTDHCPDNLLAVRGAAGRGLVRQPAQKRGAGICPPMITATLTTATLTTAIQGGGVIRHAQLLLGWRWATAHAPSALCATIDRQPAP